MNNYFRPVIFISLGTLVLFIHSSGNAQLKPVTPKIQVALLLDASSSMNGLIEQAKGQLWNMANILGRVTCDNGTPEIEIALYQYGRRDNDSSDGFVKQISPFTKDLNKIFTELVDLTTNGGEEYCGHVIYNSLNQLDWDTLSSSYKVIFIAGNESFQQGDISYTKACEEAQRKGVIINTIYCQTNERENNVKETWMLGAECGKGNFSMIDQNSRQLSIPTPFDDTIIALNDLLNETYIVYGAEGKKRYRDMQNFDTVVQSDLNDPSKVVQYVITRANSNFYSNPQWDLVDAFEKDSAIVDKIDIKTVDDSLMNKTRTEIKQIVNIALEKRKNIRSSIKELRIKQEAFIKTEKQKLINAPLTLESEIEKIITAQLRRLNMKVN